MKWSTRPQADLSRADVHQLMRAAVAAVSIAIAVAALADSWWLVGVGVVMQVVVVAAFGVLGLKRRQRRR